MDDYTDGDSAGNITVYFGVLYIVGANLVTWQSRKQKVVALSSVEAKYRGMAKGIIMASAIM